MNPQLKRGAPGEPGYNNPTKKSRTDPQGNYGYQQQQIGQQRPPNVSMGTTHTHGMYPQVQHTSMNPAMHTSQQVRPGIPPSSVQQRSADMNRMRSSSDNPNVQSIHNISVQQQQQIPRITSQHGQLQRQQQTQHQQQLRQNVPQQHAQNIPQQHAQNIPQQHAQNIPQHPRPQNPMQSRFYTQQQQQQPPQHPIHKPSIQQQQNVSDLNRMESHPRANINVSTPSKMTSNINVPTSKGVQHQVTRMGMVKESAGPNIVRHSKLGYHHSLEENIKENISKRVNEIASKNKIELGDNVIDFITEALEIRMRGIVEKLAHFSQIRNGENINEEMVETSSNPSSFFQSIGMNGMQQQHQQQQQQQQRDQLINHIDIFELTKWDPAIRKKLKR